MHPRSSHGSSAPHHHPQHSHRAFVLRAHICPLVSFLSKSCSRSTSRPVLRSTAVCLRLLITTRRIGLVCSTPAITVSLTSPSPLPSVRKIVSDSVLRTTSRLTYRPSGKLLYLGKR